MTDEQRENLKPCPFCGGAAQVIGKRPVACYEVRCTICAARGPRDADEYPYYDRNHAIEAWNMRKGADV